MRLCGASQIQLGVKNYPNGKIVALTNKKQKKEDND